MTSLAASSPPPSSPPLAPSSPVPLDSPPPQTEGNSKPKPPPKAKSQSKKKRKSKAAEVDDEIGDLLGEEDGTPGPSTSTKGKKVKKELVDDEVDELQEEGQGGEGSFKCEWGDCEVVSGLHEGLIEHVKDDHINTIKDSFICEWINCPRTGQKQASRHSLSTHMRMHTGERPYACTYAGCPKSFTRSDALQKHIKSQHLERPAPPPKPTPTPSSSTQPSKSKGKSKSRHPPIVSTPLTRAPLGAPPPTDEDLMLDEDLAEVLPRIRARDQLNPTIEEVEVLSYLRSIFPRETLDPKDPTPDSLDDPPPELAIPEEAQLLQSIPDPELPGGELDLLGRSEWQARYIMIKARLMLVEEENNMRRMELAREFERDGMAVDVEGLGY
ncbi:hypothetical protein I302_108292 [Kwoniella bestiolae CBS 10118]|uniref:C2H2-type domain-containing protein n=1 Tax=Kwoniella bestiolae CBS 10118 TaxID=1296100 RepID=A0A1B9FW55_9TREE|nr:hypothetical protein I302_07340 [Kwoniella bestiolae CBS 10118]OCF22990.1 hypothetical protein I302_07340 [Kwoniella bestiolae CBS 10118]